MFNGFDIFNLNISDHNFKSNNKKWMFRLESKLKFFIEIDIFSKFGRVKSDTENKWNSWNFSISNLKLSQLMIWMSANYFHKTVPLLSIIKY